MDRCDINLTPIGTVRNGLKKPMPRSKNGLPDDDYYDNLEKYLKKIESLESEIIIFPKYEDGLDGIEEFSHIFILFWPHLLSEQKRSTLCVHPMGRRDISKKGVFATCSPMRPNPILLSPVILIERKKNILKVRGLDALDQSLVIDIKPYLSHYHLIEGTRCPKWIEQLRKN